MVKIARVVFALESCTRSAFLAILAIFPAADSTGGSTLRHAAASSCATTRLNHSKTVDIKDAVLWMCGRSSAMNALGQGFESERCRVRK